MTKKFDDLHEADQNYLTGLALEGVGYGLVDYYGLERAKQIHDPDIRAAAVRAVEALKEFERVTAGLIPEI